MNGIKIKGMGHCVPAQVLTNEDIAQRVETSDDWITSRTGIRQRRHCAAEGHLDLCTGAAQAALEGAGVTADQIGVCVVATLAADTIVPSAACALQRTLGLPEDTVCFDLNAACTGFLFALHTVECLLNAASRSYGLVLGCDVLSRLTNWEDRSTCVLFGDGAGAAVVECRTGWPSIGAVLGVHGNESLLFCPGIGSDEPSCIAMEGQAVYKFAVAAIPWCLDQVLEKHHITVDAVDFFVFHQANARILDRVVRKYHIPPEKYGKNIDAYGNTSAASIPILLSELQAQGKLTSGSRVLVVGFGGGLTWGGALVEFA